MSGTSPNYTKNWEVLGPSDLPSMNVPDGIKHIALDASLYASNHGDAKYVFHLLRQFRELETVSIIASTPHGQKIEIGTRTFMYSPGLTNLGTYPGRTLRDCTNSIPVNQLVRFGFVFFFFFSQLAISGKGVITGWRGEGGFRISGLCCVRCTKEG